MNLTHSSKTFYQAVLFGVVTVLLGTILSMIFGFLKPELPEECEIWNKYYVFEVVMFLTGFGLRYLLVIDNVKKYMHEE